MLSAVCSLFLLDVAASLLAQFPPGTEEAVKVASERGWEAVVLVIIVLGGFGFFGYMFRHVMRDAGIREERLSVRVTQLEDMIRVELIKALSHNSEIMLQVTVASQAMVAAADRMMQSLDKFETILENRPCMALDAARRLKIVDAIVQQSERTKSEQA